MKTKKADWYEYVIGAMLVAAPIINLLVFFKIAHMEPWQQPQYVYYYLLMYLFCAALVVMLVVMAYRSDKSIAKPSWALDEERVKTLSPFAKWYAKWEDVFYVVFLLGFLYSIPYSFYFDTKYLFHISLGVEMLISTTVAACGFFALRKARKVYPPDMKPEPPEDGDEEFADMPYKYHSYKWLIWLLFLYRYVCGIRSLILWL